MYAFNSRFKPTLFKGLPNMTWAGFMLGIVLLAFSIGAYTNLRNVGLMILLVLVALASFGYAIQEYRKKDEARFLSSRFMGKKDIRTNSLGL
jgi:uncharacterized membrane protein